jgi:hypothetical protein
LPPSRTTFVVAAGYSSVTDGIVAIPDCITLYRRWLCNVAAYKFIVAGSYNFAADKFLFDSAMDGYAAIADHFIAAPSSASPLWQNISSSRATTLSLP